MPAPRPKAAIRSHQVLVEKAAKVVDIFTPARTTKAAAMSMAVAYSGSTPATHHTTAQHRIARQMTPCWLKPTLPQAKKTTKPATIPSTAPIAFFLSMFARDVVGFCCEVSGSDSAMRSFFRCNAHTYAQNFAAKKNRPIGEAGKAQGTGTSAAATLRRGGTLSFPWPIL